MTWIGPRGTEEVEVPDVVGQTVSVARQIAAEAGLTLGAEDPDGSPLAALTWPGVWVVVAQDPAPGSPMRRKGTMAVQFVQATGEAAGVREPRRPPTPIDVLAAERDPAEDVDPPGGDFRW